MGQRLGINEAATVDLLAPDTTFAVPIAATALNGVTTPGKASPQAIADLGGGGGAQLLHGFLPIDADGTNEIPIPQTLNPRAFGPETPISTDGEIIQAYRGDPTNITVEIDGITINQFGTYAISFVASWNITQRLNASSDWSNLVISIERGTDVIPMYSRPLVYLSAPGTYQHVNNLMRTVIQATAGTRLTFTHRIYNMGRSTIDANSATITLIETEGNTRTGVFIERFD